jgi:predicted secreted acid phosphatase
MKVITDKEFYYYNKNKYKILSIYNYIKNEYLYDICKVIFNSIQLVKKNKKDSITSKPNCVVFDLDETFLCNDFYKFYILEVFQYNRLIYDYYKSRIPSNIGPILPFIIILYEYLIYHNIKIIFLSGRNEEWREQTIENLNIFNINNNYLLYLKPKNLNSHTFKQEIIDEIEKKYNILLCLNDQKEFIHKNLLYMPQLYII